MKHVVPPRRRDQPVANSVPNTQPATVSTRNCNASGIARGYSPEMARTTFAVDDSPDLGRLFARYAVVDLVAGSKLHFTAPGAHRLANRLYKWHVYAWRIIR